MHLELEEKIEELAKKKEISELILSVYIGNRAKDAPSTKILLAQFQYLVGTYLSSHLKKEFRKCIEKMEDYIREIVEGRNIRTLAFFCGGDFFQAIDFELYLPTMLTVQKNPYITPITNLVKRHRKYFILLVDNAKARFFTVHLGKIEEHEEIFDPSVPQRVRANEEHFYGRSDKIFRHIQDHLNRHLKLIAEKARQFITENQARFVIVGGHEQIFKKIIKRLPKNIRDKIRGTFVTELNIPASQVLRESQRFIENKKL